MFIANLFKLQPSGGGIIGSLPIEENDKSGIYKASIGGSTRWQDRTEGNSLPKELWGG